MNVYEKREKEENIVKKKIMTIFHCRNWGTIMSTTTRCGGAQIIKKKRIKMVILNARN